MAPHVLSLREILLTNVGFSVANERQTITAVQNHIIAAIPNLFPNRKGQSLPQEVPFGRLSIAAKAEISRWLRQQVASLTSISIRTIPTKTGEEETIEVQISTITPDSFSAVR